MTLSKQENFSLFNCWFLLFIWQTVADMNFRFFVEATIYEPIIMLTLLAWKRHQNKKTFVCVNTECFCFINCCWHEFQGFHGSNHLSIYNYFDAYYVMASSEGNNFCLCNSFHDGSPYHIETSKLTCRANQCTGFFMLETFVMKVKCWPLLFIW